MLWKFKIQENGLTKSDTNILVENNRDTLYLIDTDVLIDGLYVQNITERDIEYYIKNFDVDRETAKDYIKLRKDAAETLIETFADWNTGTKSAVPVITDFIKMEAECVAREHGMAGINGSHTMRKYLSHIGRTENGLCIYLGTIFRTREKRSNSSDLLPNVLQNELVGYKADNPCVRDHDISMYATAYSISKNSNMKVSIITDDKLLKGFIEEANKATRKPIFHYSAFDILAIHKITSSRTGS